MMRGLGYTRLISMENFRTPNAIWQQSASKGRLQVAYWSLWKLECFLHSSFSSYFSSLLHASVIHAWKEGGNKVVGYPVNKHAVFMYTGWNKEDTAGNWKYCFWWGESGGKNRQEESWAREEPETTWDTAECQVLYTCWQWFRYF